MKASSPEAPASTVTVTEPARKRHHQIGKDTPAARDGDTAAGGPERAMPLGLKSFPVGYREGGINRTPRRLYPEIPAASTVSRGPADPGLWCR
jgi:hypothetical protein